MRYISRPNIFSLNTSLGEKLTQPKYSIIMGVLLILSVISLAQNLSQPEEPPVNQWKYYEQGFNLSH